MIYLQRLAAHCGIRFGDIIRVYPDNTGSAPVYCIVAASNLSLLEAKFLKLISSKKRKISWARRKNKWYEVSYE